MRRSMEYFYMDERAVTVKGADACQGEITIEDCSVSNGTIDADGAQVRGAERVSDAHGVQVVGSNGSMGSGGIAGAGSQLGAAEDLTPRRPPPSNKPAHWATMTPAQW